MVANLFKVKKQGRVSEVTETEAGMKDVENNGQECVVLSSSPNCLDLLMDMLPACMTRSKCCKRSRLRTALEMGR